MNRELCDVFLDTLLADKTADCIRLTLDHGGETVYQYGKSNFSKEVYRCLDDSTRFNIGSVTKIFTASLVVKLMEQGLLAVNDKVCKYIPEYPFDDVAIYDLLNHTAGYTERDGTVTWPKQLDGQRGYLNSIYAIRTRENPLRQYSNYWSCGYSVLMDILQRRSGKSIETLAREYLFDPLRMDKTTYDVGRIDLANVIWPKSAETGELLDYSHTPPVGDSGLLSTAEDLRKYGRALLDIYRTQRSGIFSVASVNYMFHEDTGEKFSRTPVFWHKDRVCEMRGMGSLTSDQTVCHTGFSGCILLLDPAYDLVLAMTTNSIAMHMDSTNYDRIINRLWSAVL